MTMRKRYGDSGHPCLIPVSCLCHLHSPPANMGRIAKYRSSCQRYPSGELRRGSDKTVPVVVCVLPVICFKFIVSIVCCVYYRFVFYVTFYICMLHSFVLVVVVLHAVVTFVVVALVVVLVAV